MLCQCRGLSGVFQLGRWAALRRRAGSIQTEIGRDKSGKCVAQRQFAFLRTLPGGLSAPSNWDLT